MLRTRGVYSVLVVKALAAAEPGGAKGGGGSLASFFKCTDNQSVPRVGHVRSKWHLNGTYVGPPSYAITAVWFPEQGDADCHGWILMETRVSGSLRVWAAGCWQTRSGWLLSISSGSSGQGCASTGGLPPTGKAWVSLGVAW